MQFICEENLSDYAFVNIDTLKLPVKAVCVDFHGYTDATTYSESPDKARLLGEHGIAWVFPYYSVWAWMSESSQEFNEQVLDAVYRKLRISDTIPLIITGGSMGGLTALCYLIYGKRRAAACAVNCPVTDMAKFFDIVPNARRAILSAHILNKKPIRTIMHMYSPIKLVDKLPMIPYLLVYGEKDERITENFMPQFLERMKEKGHNVTYLLQKDMVHCDIDGHKDSFDIWCDFIITNGSKWQSVEIRNSRSKEHEYFI